MLNSTYTSSAMAASSLPALLTSVSSTCTMQQSSLLGNPQLGGVPGQQPGYVPGQQPGYMPGSPYGAYGSQTMVFPQAVPYAGGMPVAPGGYPGAMGPAPMPGQLYYQPARIVTGLAQTFYRAYIPPTVSMVPSYPPIQQPAPMPMGYGPRWV